MTSEAPEIAAVVLTHNEAARIDACLAMLRRPYGRAGQRERGRYR